MHETPGFIDIGGEQLFVTLHTPTEPASRIIVMCHALGEEKLWAHRVFVSFARDMAAQGFAVMRVDHRGEGESDREFEYTDLDTRVEDVCRTLDSLRDLVPNAEEVTLLGLRMGTVVAARTASSRSDVSRLVLWDPVLDGAAYMQTVLRMNLSFQMAQYHRVIRDREALVAHLSQGGTVNIEGYELSESLYSQVSAFRLREMLQRVKAETILVQISATEGSVRRELEEFAADVPTCRVVAVREEPFWREGRKFCGRASELTRITALELRVI